MNELSDYRYERKFSLPGLSKQEIERIIKFLPGFFSEIFYERLINNIYLDTFNNTSYFDNINGLRDRKKVRIRWYGDLFGIIEKPILEFKMKKGLLGFKASYPLSEFTFNKDFEKKTIKNLVNFSDLKDIIKLELDTLEPTMVNRYKRKYFQSADKRIRITIDTEMTYYDVNMHYNSFLHNLIDQTGVIVEIKYNASDDGFVKSLLRSIPFRVSRSSKYINGKDSLTLI